MQPQEAPTLDRDLPELSTRFVHDPLADDFSDLTFSPEDDAKLNAAAKWSKSAVEAGLAGDVTAMRNLHVTRWEVRRAA